MPRAWPGSQAATMQSASPDATACHIAAPDTGVITTSYPMPLSTAARMLVATTASDHST